MKLEEFGCGLFSVALAVPPSCSFVVQVVPSPVQRGGDQATARARVLHGHSPTCSCLQLLGLLQDLAARQHCRVHVPGLEAPLQQEVHLGLGLLHFLPTGAGLCVCAADYCAHL